MNATTPFAALRAGIWADRVFAALIGHARLVGAVLALLTVAALWQATHLRVEVDLSGLISPRSEGARAIGDYARRFDPMRAEEVLLVTAPTLASEEALAAFEDMVLDIQFVPGVERVVSLWSLPAPGRAGSWLAGPELAVLPPAERLALMRDTDPLAAQLLSPDLTGTVVVIAAEPGAYGTAFLAELRAVAQAPGLEVAEMGLAAVQRMVAAELIRDLWVLTPAAVAVCLLFSLLLFRDWRAVVVCALPPIIGLIWVAGWLGASGIAIDPVMGALPVVLIVLAYSDSMHMWHAARHRIAGTSGPERTAALARALTETAPAAALTTVTTGVAFASLLLADSPSLDRMAKAGVGGMAVTLAAVLLLVPVLMGLLGAPRPGTRVPVVLYAVVAPAQRMARWRLVPLLALAVLAGLWLAQSQSREGFRYADYLPEGADVTRALDRAEALGLGSDRLLVVVEAEPALGPGPAANARLAALALWGEDRAAWLDGSAGAEMLGRMQARDGTAHALPVQLPISAAGQAADAGLRDLEARLAAAGLAERARIVGPGHALVTEGPRMVDGLRRGLYLTILAVTVLIALVHRSIRVAAVALVPNLIPILGVEAWLALTGREVTIMNMIALTVAFGIAVDDTLHVLNRLRLAREGDLTARLDRAIAAAGPPVAATTMVLMAGLVVTLASALPGLAIFGLLIAIAVALALLADLFLLPGLLRWSLR